MAGGRAYWRQLHLPRPLTPPEVLVALPPGPGRCLLETVLLPSAAAGADGAPPPTAPGTTAPGACRYSLVGAEPDLFLTAVGNRIQIHGSGKTWYRRGDPLHVLESLLTRRRVEPGPLPVAGAAVGYVGYDLNRLYEPVGQLAAPAPPLPELYVAFYDLLVVIDHHSGELWLSGAKPAVQTDLFLGKVRRWLRSLQAASGAPPAAGEVTAPVVPPPATPTRVGPLDNGVAPSLLPSLTAPAYRRMIESALQYIAAGDIFEVNLANRFACAVPPALGPVPGWPLYLRLRQTAPAPFAAYLEGPGFQVASASPERFLLAAAGAGDRPVESRPIKGTRPRHPDPTEDQAQAAALLASAKDRAELVMAVDVARNDLGRVCRFGTVTVTELVRLESFPTVHHTVATVAGRLRPETGVAELLRATFPPASITGAPKVRAMQIIEELEPVRRGVYTGALGYWSYDGRMDLNVAIRTLCVTGGHVYFHCGGGIVADSDPESEWQESLLKGRSLAAALGLSLHEEVAACTSG